MPYPYKKMTQEDFDKIIEITDNERVWVGDEIAKEYYKDEMPEYGVFPPELYVEVLNKEEVSEIMKYAYEQNIPVVCRGAGTGLAGGATCKYGGIMLSVMRMNKIFPVDHKNQTITAQPGLIFRRQLKKKDYSTHQIQEKKQLLSVEMSLPTQVE